MDLSGSRRISATSCWSTAPELDALIRALSGTPYSKTTTGETVTNSPSAFGQVAGLGLGIAGLL